MKILKNNNKFSPKKYQLKLNNQRKANKKHRLRVVNRLRTKLWNRS